ncbi:MAG: hypothetical protein ACM34A_12065 [Bacillota bacterium]
MKYLAIGLALFAITATAKDVYVKPHVNRDGTYVEGHYRSVPNSNPYDNYSSQGNVNPYTGQAGTVNPYNQPVTPVYPQQQRCRKDIYGNIVC